MLEGLNYLRQLQFNLVLVEVNSNAKNVTNFLVKASEDLAEIKNLISEIREIPMCRERRFFFSPIVLANVTN